jgi:radical SAM superfamily enzyme YgiQ (UPF0313 family)
VNEKIVLVKIGQKSRVDLSTIPPVGLGYIAAILMKLGYNVKIVDMKIEGLNAGGVALKIKEEYPAIAGLSVLTTDAAIMLDTARAIKEISPHVKIIVGGPHATVHYEKLALNPHIDVVVVGEGEDTVQELAPALLNGNNLHPIKGIAFKNGGGVTFTGSREPIQDLNHLPFPAFELLDLPKYYTMMTMAPLGPRRCLPIFTSRGCPYRCIYCHKIFGKQFRPRSPQNIIAEIKHMKEQFGVSEFEVLDDIFNLDVKRMHEMLDLIIEEKLNIKFSFPNGLRSDLLDEESIIKLKKAGAVHLCFAVETASPRLQKLIRKNNKLDKIAENIEIAHRHRIYTVGLFMMGFPTETEEELLLTMNFALQSKLSQANFYLVIPFEKTELWELARKHYKLSDDNYYLQDYCLNDFNLSEVDLDRLHKIHRQCYRTFYLNPARILNLISTHPNKTALFRFVYLLMRRMLGL